MAKALVLTAPQAMTNPAPDTPVLRIAGDSYPITSDTFSGANASPLTARTSDALKGGQPLPYAFSNTNTFALASNRLTTVGGTSAMLLQLPADRSPDVTVTMRVVTLPDVAGAGGFLMARRDAVSAPSNWLRLVINPTFFTLNVGINGTTPTFENVVVPLSAGDVIGIREYRGLVQLLKNGAVAGSVTFPAGQLIGDFAGFAAQNTTAGSFVYDDFLITETIR